MNRPGTITRLQIACVAVPPIVVIGGCFAVVLLYEPGTGVHFPPWFERWGRVVFNALCLIWLVYGTRLARRLYRTEPESTPRQPDGEDATGGGA